MIEEEISSKSTLEQLQFGNVKAPDPVLRNPQELFMSKKRRAGLGCPLAVAQAIK